MLTGEYADRPKLAPVQPAVYLKSQDEDLYQPIYLYHPLLACQGGFGGVAII